MRCKHCKDEIETKLCSICKKDITNQCITCHKEIAHNEIKIQNVHIVGGKGNKTDWPEDDYDAYAPSWKVDN